MHSYLLRLDSKILAEKFQVYSNKQYAKITFVLLVSTCVYFFLVSIFLYVKLMTNMLSFEQDLWRLITYPSILICLIVYIMLFRKFEILQRYFDVTLIMSFIIFTSVINKPIEDFEFFSAYFLAASMYVGIIIFKRFMFKILMAGFSISYTIYRVYSIFDENFLLFLYYMILSTIIMLVYIYNN